MGGRVITFGQTWVTKLVRQMRDFAQEPSHWWIYWPGTEFPDLQGKKPTDYTHIQDNIAFMLAVDFFPGPRPEAIWRLNIGSDKYKATDIPLHVLTEAKRVVFGSEVPSLNVHTNRADGRDWWQFSLAMSAAEKIFRAQTLVDSPQEVAS